MTDTAIIEVSDSDSLDESNPPVSHKCVRKLTQKGRAAETATKKARTDAAVKQTQLDEHLELIDTHNADEKLGADNKAWHLFQLNHPFDDLVDADVPLKTSKGGHSRNILLDNLSIPCKTISTSKDCHQCAFKGCRQSWAGVCQAVRVYKHIEHECRFVDEEMK